MSSPFQALHAALQSQVERQFLSGASSALLRGREVVDRFVCGQADVEAGVPLREDHIFRVFSNTKLLTSCAVLLLMEDGRLRLDDPVERYLPQLARRQVLRAGATRIDQVEPARRAITLHDLMTHTSGLSYGLFDPGTVLYQAYGASGVHKPMLSQAQFIDLLATLPLAFQPGERWEYSLATDVLARVVEVVSGQSLGEFFQARICGPLGMGDTAFWVPEPKRARLTALYGGTDFMNPLQPGLVRMDAAPYPGAYTSPASRQSGGGGLVSTLDDTVRLVQALMPGEGGLLRPDTLAQMARNQVAPGLHVQFPNMPSNPGRVFGLGSSVLAQPGVFDPPQSAGEVSWGGLAGTVWWINPRLNIAGVLMTQRYYGFGNPYTFEWRHHAYRALGH
ncbi:MAG: beta-lactamase family protein [Burkholderiales bacterium]|uniref:serine hydrolase domain-containing protein n=1 Tax=Ottowia sp. TaxID=1898956 RepID=UPI001ACC0C45|nr:serine hydrolase domain-containing protein [Ottowia sp.]MBN9406139.1 beta-lactamase family protein [Burkholderiales bacterium]MBS0403855.1 beta-lactamase family protein [Pseudomonadota bacterium]MBS0415583.1 beta-lactamase family protein [Pseudomonadota bacterium]